MRMAYAFALLTNKAQPGHFPAGGLFQPFAFAELLPIAFAIDLSPLASPILQHYVETTTNCNV